MQNVILRKMEASIEPQLQEWITTHQSLLIQTAQELVQAASPNPSGDVEEVATRALTIIKRLIPSSKVDTYQTAPGVLNVVAVITGSRPGKRLVFSGHLDTYPVGNGVWTFPPFGGVLSDDAERLYGRGSADMKGGIAASLLAAAALEKFKEHWSGEVVIALAGDEETMGTLGTGYLLDHVPDMQCDAMICGDAGSPLVVRAGEKGLVWVEIEASGKPAHGAHVHKGVNAIERLMEALSRLKSLEQIKFEGPSEVNSFIDDAQEVSESLGGEGELETLKRLTVNIGTIKGGTSPNLVPDQASAAADIRLPMGITAEGLAGHIQDSLGSLEGITFRIIRKYDPSWTSPSEPIVIHALETCKAIAGSNAVVNMRVGASDGRLFRKKGIPTVIVGLTPFNMGGADEYLLVAEMEQVARIHALTALKYLQSA